MKYFWGDWRHRLPYRRYREQEDRRRRLRAQFLAGLTLLSGSLYLLWLAHQAVSQADLPAYLFFLAEGLALALLFTLSVDVSRRRYHRPDGLPGGAQPTVDVMVTCCGESLEVIRTTLTAVKHLDYQPLTVYVLDDAGSPAVALLAESLGFQYHSRRQAGVPLSDSKSGNLNFGLSVSGGEIILVLDADQVPQPELISRMIGFFQLPQVAYVQSQQSFWLPDNDPFFNRDAIFYETLQPSNDEVNAVVSCGSGVLYRRRALMDVGGFLTWNLVEDLTTSYELLSRGWKGIYFPYILSRGLAPQTFRDVCRQRFQWCLDTMRLFFWDNPIFKPGLSTAQRLHFLIVMFSYLFSGLVLPVFYLVPLYSYCFGKSFLAGQEWHYGLLRGVYLVLTILAFRYLFFGQNALKQFKVLCGLFPVYAVAIFSALWYYPGHKPVYQVNNRARRTVTRNWPWFLPHFALIALHLTLPFLSLHYEWATPRLIAMNSLFSAFTLWVLGETVFLGLSRPQWRPAMDPRFVYGFKS